MKCVNCLEEFKPKRSDAVFCSDKCRKALSRTNKQLPRTNVRDNKSDKPDSVRDNPPSIADAPEKATKDDNKAKDSVTGDERSRSASVPDPKNPRTNVKGVECDCGGYDCANPDKVTNEFLTKKHPNYDMRHHPHWQDVTNKCKVCGWLGLSDICIPCNNEQIKESKK